MNVPSVGDLSKIKAKRRLAMWSEVSLAKGCVAVFEKGSEHYVMILDVFVPGSLLQNAWVKVLTSKGVGWIRVIHVTSEEDVKPF